LKTEELAPLAVTGLDSSAADAIRRQILSGSLAPGAHLVEADMAGRLAVSRGTIRAAFKLLITEGLLAYQRNRGVYVTEFDSRDAEEIYTLRNTLEAMAARMAAERIDKTGAQRLQAAHRKLEEAISDHDRAAIIISDLEIHELIVHLSGHRRLEEAYRRVHAQTLLFMVFSDTYVPEMRIGMEIHKPMIAAITTGDAREAERLAATHNTTDGEKLVGLLRDAEGAADPAMSEPRTV
jgi:DNA-binding GntR family transcriptional regulator